MDNCTHCSSETSRECWAHCFWAQEQDDDFYNDGYAAWVMRPWYLKAIDRVKYYIEVIYSRIRYKKGDLPF
jgi:hypothetical protein